MTNAFLRSFFVIALAGAATLHAGPTTNFAGVQAFVFSPFSTTVYQTGFDDFANMPVNLSWSCDTSCVGFSATGAGQAGLGVLGTMVDLNVPSLPSAGFIAIAETIAHFTDDLTMTGGTGTGVLELDYSVHGTSNNPLASAELDVCDAQGCTGDPNIFFSVDGGALTAQSSRPASFSGDGTAKFYLQFTYGVPFEIEPFMSVQAQFPPSGRPTPFDATASFNNTATITGAFVLNGTSSAPGSVVTGATITDDDGFTFGPNGLTAGVPEPGTWLLAASALVGLVLVKRRRRA